MRPSHTWGKHDASRPGHRLQLPKHIRRPLPERLAIIDEFCAGYSGSNAELAEAISARFDAPHNRVMRFIEGLEAAGYLCSGAAPQPVDAPPTSAAQVGDEALYLPTPTSVMASAGHYLWYSHGGELLAVLSLAETHAAVQFCRPATADEAWARYVENIPGERLARDAFDALLSRLVGAGALLPAPPEAYREDVAETPVVDPYDRRAMVQASVDERVAEHDEQQGDAKRTEVVPVNVSANTTPAGLGFVMAYAMEYEGGALLDKYSFVPLFLADEARLIERAARPGIFLFSNYLWTVEENLRLSAAIKAVSPASITIHGGPSTPKYDRDSDEFFADNPHVDITVKGEGELTFAEVLKALDPDNLGDLERLRDVEGVIYRSGQGVVRTGNRDRIADLNTIPSPYLTGMFDPFGASRAGAILESNRGCPFGCTFCDWGSATLSRVRRFDIDRVFAEIEWCAKNKIQTASFADANFGMLERDVSIAEKIAEMKRTYGYPKTVATNYAKNNVKHLRKIIEILADVEILTEGVVSLQSMDETTLKVIDRSNIKLDKYNDLTTEFRQAHLPLAADIMMGLPGSTPRSFFNDLQECTDRDVRVRANPTLLLTNSPMNDPEYRKKYGIVARPGDIVQETASYTRQEWDDMNELRVAFNLFDNWGVLRYVGRFVRSVTGMGEVAFYDALRREALRDPENWPFVATTLKTLEQNMAPPGSWGLFINEVRRFLVDKLSIADDSALRTTLAVQLAHLPAPARRFPEVLQLEHDFAAWQNLIFAAREGGHKGDWEKHVPSLSEFGPATLTVKDPNEVCRVDLGKPMGVMAYAMRNWEMDSSVARPSLGAVS